MAEPTKTRVNIDLSKPKPVPPDFVEVYHLKHDNMIGVRWRRNPEPDILGYNIYYSRTPNGPWIRLNGALVNALEYVHKCVSSNSNVNHYYVVQAVNSYRVEGELSLPNRLQVELERNNHLSFATREIKRRAEMIAQWRGEEVDLYQVKYDGERCPCVNLAKMEAKKGCHICYGTSYVGGYYEPQRIWMSYEEVPRMVKLEEHGLTVENKPKAWTLWEPVLHDRDILVTDDNKRFEVLNIKITQGQGRDIIRQIFDLQELDSTHIAFTLTRKSVEAVTPSTIEEEITGQASDTSGIFEGTFGSNADIIGGRDADGNASQGFVRHSPHKQDNIFTKDVRIEMGHKGYESGVRHNIGKWSGYISNRLGTVVNTNESIQLYASDSTLKAKSRPDSSLVFSEIDFTASLVKPFEYSCEMKMVGTGYFSYQTVGMADISNFVENQFADLLWYKTVNNVHFGIGTGEIFSGRKRAFVLYNDDLVQQVNIEDSFDVESKNWLKISFDGATFRFIVNDTVIMEYNTPKPFNKFRVLMGAGAWAGEDVNTVKPVVTETYVDVYQFTSNQPLSFKMFKPNVDYHFFKDHVVEIGRYDGELISAVVTDSFNTPALNTDLWHIGSVAKGHSVNINNGRLAISGMTPIRMISLATICGNSINKSEVFPTETYVTLKEMYKVVAKLTVDVLAGSAGNGRSHNIVTITNLQDNPENYAAFGIFFRQQQMIEVGFSTAGGWEIITKLNDINMPSMQKLRIIYDFKNLNSQFYVNDELVIERTVPSFLAPVVTLSSGYTKENLQDDRLYQTINLFDNFRACYEYLPKAYDALDLT